MQFGFFDDQRREYVITSPRTPLPWINYLGSEDFFTLLSNTAGGYCFYRDARLRRLTRYRYNNCPVDQEGFHIYIQDGDTVWNPGWQPAKTELDRYTCRHGLGYSVIEGQKNGVSAAQTLLVPQGDNCLLIRLTLDCRGKDARCVPLCRVLPLGRDGRRLQLPAELLHRRGRAGAGRHLSQIRIPRTAESLCRVLGEPPV